MTIEVDQALVEIMDWLKDEPEGMERRDIEDFVMDDEVLVEAALAEGVRRGVLAVEGETYRLVPQNREVDPE